MRELECRLDGSFHRAAFTSFQHPNYTTGQPNHDLAVIRLNLQYGNDSKNHFCVIPNFEFMYAPANIYALSKANKSMDCKPHFLLNQT